MKNERKNTVLSIVIDALITFVKIYAGLIFNSYTLMVSGYNTLLDTSMDFVAYTGSIFRGRRANKKEPFGYGTKENITLIFLGIFIILLGIYMGIKTFFLEFSNPNLRILVPIFVIVICLLTFANYLFKIAKNEQSMMLMNLAHDHYMDLIMTIFIVFFIFLSKFIPVFDMLGTLFGCLVFIYKGIIIIINNLLYLKGQNDQSKKVIKEIKSLVNEIDGIKYSNCNLVNVKNFYKVIIEVLISDDVSLHDLILWEEYEKGKIKSSKMKIRFVEFIVYRN